MAENRGILERWCEDAGGERSGLYVAHSGSAGHPAVVGPYRLGLEHFRWLYFDAAGDLARTQEYVDGEPVAPR